MKTYSITEAQLEELLKKQRELCVQNFRSEGCPDHTITYTEDLNFCLAAIENCPSPPLPEAIQPQSEIIEPANTSATINDSCVTPLYVQNNIEHMETLKTWRGSFEVIPFNGTTVGEFFLVDYNRQSHPSAPDKDSEVVKITGNADCNGYYPTDRGTKVKGYCLLKHLRLLLSDNQKNTPIEGLREKFYNWISENPKVWPKHIFEWFKPYLHGTIDWKEFENKFYDDCVFEEVEEKLVINDSFSDNPDLFINWLKTNLPKYIK